MVKLSLGSLLGSSTSSSRNDLERKKENRRSFAGFNLSSSPLGNRNKRLSSIPNGNSQDLIGKTARPSTSTTASDNMDIVNPVGPRDEDAVKSTTTGGATTTTVATTNGATMTELADKISRETAKLEKYMKENGLPMPSFDVNAADDFPRLPEEIQQSRLEIVDATKQLRDLTVGPRESVRWGVWDVSFLSDKILGTNIHADQNPQFFDVLALQMINSYGLANLVPLDHPITLTDLGKLTPLDPVNLARILRTAMTNHIFHEPTPNTIAHTASSRLLATDPELAAWIGFNSEDIFPSAAHVLPALREYPEATSLTQAGFQFAFDTVDKEPMFATFGKDAARAKRMGRAMASLTGGEGYEVAYFVDEYDFADLDARGGTFVDVGGSHGFVCVDLARKWRNMRFVVQDLQKTVESAPKPVDKDSQVAERVRFASHDFFTQQELVGDGKFVFCTLRKPLDASSLSSLGPL